MTVATRLFLRIREKGAHYWLTALVIFLLAISGAPYVYEYLHVRELRSNFFQLLLEFGPKPPEPKFVRIVTIEDDEYWRGYPAGRRPIKRDYLAKLVDALVSANAHVIALDFDTRLPDPTKSDPTKMDIPKDYREETSILIDAIINAAERGKKVVLATPISRDEQGHYQQDPDIYQAFGLCKRGASGRSDENPGGLTQRVTNNITCAYIGLPYDPLVIPSRLTLVDGGKLDSFALALVRAVRPEYVASLLERIGNNVSYGDFISQKKFKDSNAMLSAGAVLQGTSDKEILNAGIVIVGANWSSLAAGRGPPVDRHWTPVGWMVGAVIHANFAEAMLDSRTFSATPHWVLRGTEIVFSLIAAITFALIPNILGKVGGVLSLFVLLFLCQWAALHGFGVFFDAFVPLLGLGLHSLYERLIGPHNAKSSNR